MRFVDAFPFSNPGMPGKGGKIIFFLHFFVFLVLAGMEKVGPGPWGFWGPTGAAGQPFRASYTGPPHARHVAGNATLLLRIQDKKRDIATKACHSQMT